MFAVGQAGRSTEIDSHRIGRTLSRNLGGAIPEGNAGTGAQASDVANGKANYNRLGNPDEQRTRGYRGAVALRYFSGEDRYYCPPSIRRSLDGGVCGRIGRRSTRYG